MRAFHIGLNAAASAAAFILAGCAEEASSAQPIDSNSVDAAINAVHDKVIEWRRDIHAHPELANEETRTAKRVADHLRGLGLDVRAGVAHTGVIGVLKGARPGPTVALRADMDAIPGDEKTDLAFASKVRTTLNGQETGIMHACGHDAHVAMLMGAAEALAGLREEIAGTVVFIFQPAEEIGADAGGAKLMIEEGALENPKPDAIFGLHVAPYEPGVILYKPGAIMAGNDTFELVVTGAQTHGGMPWNGVDSISAAAEIILALNGVAARQLNTAIAPTVITVGVIKGGVRSDIIPEKVRLSGSVRSLDPSTRAQALKSVDRTVHAIAGAWGAKAQIEWSTPYAVTYNNVDLTTQMLPVLKEVAGNAGVQTAPNVMAAEDFSFFQHEIPGMYFFLGINDEGVPPEEAFPNHSPHFYINEDALEYGTRAHVMLALKYLSGEGKSASGADEN